MDLSSPVYYKDGNVRSMSISGSRSDITMHLSDFAYLCDEYVFYINYSI